MQYAFVDVVGGLGADLLTLVSDNLPRSEGRERPRVVSTPAPLHRAHTLPGQGPPR